MINFWRFVLLEDNDCGNDWLAHMHPLLADVNAAACEMAVNNTAIFIAFIIAAGITIWLWKEFINAN